MKHPYIITITYICLRKIAVGCVSCNFTYYTAISGMPSQRSTDTAFCIYITCVVAIRNIDTTCRAHNSAGIAPIEVIVTCTYHWDPRIVFVSNDNFTGVVAISNVRHIFCLGITWFLFIGYSTQNTDQSARQISDCSYVAGIITSIYICLSIVVCFSH